MAFSFICSIPLDRESPGMGKVLFFASSDFAEKAEEKFFAVRRFLY